MEESVGFRWVCHGGRSSAYIARGVPYMVNLKHGFVSESAKRNFVRQISRFVGVICRHGT